MIIASFFVYIAAGISIYKKDRQLHRFASQSESTPAATGTNNPIMTVFNTVNTVSPDSFKMTEIQISSDPTPVTQGPMPNAPTSFSRPRFEPGSLSDAQPTPPSPSDEQQDQKQITTDLITEVPYKPYTVVVETGHVRSTRAFAEMRSSARRDRHFASWTYTKYSMLFFLAMIVTWVFLLFLHLLLSSDISSAAPGFRQPHLQYRAPHRAELGPEPQRRNCAAADGVLEHGYLRRNVVASTANHVVRWWYAD